MIYLVQYFGDCLRDPAYVNHNTVWETLDDALTAISLDFYDEPPDPEDDRIVIWTLEPGGKMQAVWHFSGWHYDSEEFGLPQGTLPGDSTSLYIKACKEY